MTTKEIAPALSPEALLGKSKVFIARALAAKNQKAMGEYQLWASLALELLGKSALAAIHPCLVADPQSYVSLFAAAGMHVGTDLKTITAKTLFERLSHASKRFDKKTQEYCERMSLKRNAELHSGEAPFEAVIPTSWEGAFGTRPKSSSKLADRLSKNGLVLIRQKRLRNSWPNTRMR
jgi:hypothetical protein